MKKTALFLLPLLMVNSAFAQEIKSERDQIGYFRLPDQRGLIVFETPPQDSVEFQEVKVRLGGDFAIQYQGLSHSNGAEDGTSNELIELGTGFNLATANMNFDVALEDGIRMNVTVYLSSRHHPEAWVKGGYLQVDKLTVLNNDFINRLMKNVTLKIGHMEINYGDAHFRRTDNARAIYNPFVGNYLLDAFDTEVGMEAYFQKNGWLVMLAGSNGTVKPDVTNTSADPAFYGKIGYDNQLNDKLRLRLTTSAYVHASSPNQTLYSGDRSGSRYYSVVVNDAMKSSFTTGRINPNFAYGVNSVMVNPFVKYGNFEFFGLFELASGTNNSIEDTDRNWTQIGVDLIYRFAKDKLYLGARYNTLSGEPYQVLNEDGDQQEVTINRMQGSLGWFLTKNMLIKAEYVDQQYLDYPDDHLYNEATFNGVMLEAAISF